MESEKGEWIKEASDIERLYELSHKRRSFLLAYQLSLSSLQPLEEGHVRKALIHLHRKCPALRICFGERNGQTWLRYMRKEELDFQVVKDAEPDEIRDLLQTYRYNSEEGPLWCARLLLCENDPLALDKELPYISHLFIGIHHGICDGFTMMKVCGAFVRILNDVIDNKPVCDKDQIGYFVQDPETEKIVSAKMSAIQMNPSLMQEIISNADDKGIGIPLLLKVQPLPDGEDKTCNLTHVLDKDTTSRFLDKCRAEGVTFSAGFSALVNVAIASFLVENNYIQDYYRICSGQLINLRRYWTADRTESLGCHILAPLYLWAKVPIDFSTKFWDFARTLHRDLLHHIKIESIFVREAYAKLTNSKDLDYDDIYFSSNPMQIDCTFSNLGDVTDFLGDTGGHVKPYFLGRHISLHYSDIKNFSYFIHTFRGRFIVSILYNTKFVTKAVTQKHCDQIFTIMEKVLNGTIY
ncbi:uncharacterized protein [Palaemon carinicauda]|uniref:uncharacterized protein isoform X2 n=1 Tax=Palaemon carinicauda TaxID=392227 RepID=UPI0035B5C1EC